MTIRPATGGDADAVLALWEVGRTAHSAAEDRLRTLGIPRVQALVGRDDEDARAFWTSAGYPVEPGTVRHVRNV
jgi:hypothetical protein